MAPMKTPSKRVGESVDADDVTTPKREKKTPAKKTPKVVKLGSGTPMSKSPVKLSSPISTPVSTKKALKKTPLKPKTPSALTPANTASPQAGKMSEPSPLMTRSQRKRKSVLNATIGTPITKNVSPLKAVSAKKTPSSKASTPKAGGKKGKKQEEVSEDEEGDLKLQLDSDDDEEIDSDDVASADEDVQDEPEDEKEKEMRAAELKAILSKPAGRKSILKMNTDSPKTPGKVQLKTIVDEAPVTPKARKNAALAAKKIDTAEAKTPAKEQAKSPIKADASVTLKEEVVSPKAEAVQAAVSPVKEVTNIKSPAKAQMKTPAKTAPATPKVGKLVAAATEAATVVSEVSTAVSSPVKAAVLATPKSNKKGAKPVNSPTEKPSQIAAIPSPAKISSETSKIEEAPAPTAEEDDSEEKKESPAEKISKNKKTRKAKKAAALKSGAEESPVNAKASEKIIKLVEAIKADSKVEISSTSTQHEKQLVAQANEERFERIRQELIAQGKSEDEVTSKMRNIRLKMKQRLKNTRCLRCRKVGHMQKDCPTAKVAIKCYKCGDPSHRAKVCAIKEEVYTFADCYLCHQQGHLTRTCPSNKNGLYPNGGSCHKCQDVWHFAKDCPKVRDMKKEQDENDKPLQKKQFVGMRDITDKKQSADADDFEPVDEKKSILAAKQGKKKQVVKF